MIYDFIVQKADVRLDSLIAETIPGVSRSYAVNLISEGLVLVNGKTCKPSVKAALGSSIHVDLPAPVLTDAVAENIPLDIVYEDSDLLVINKPQGMVVHPAAGHVSGTLVNALLYYCKGQLSDINGVIRPGIIHRIDKDTSGLLIAVKNNDIHEKMAKMIAAHDVVRKYRCCVYGVMDTDKGTIDAPIGRSGTDRRRMTVKADGKPSITHFEVVERFKQATDLSVVLETGRTHQIRSHLSFIDHPAIGDPIYASKKPTFGMIGQALHSKSLSFIHPSTGKRIDIEIDLPEYYERLIQTLRTEN
jgi:23S rRNA pseudouridine1911/1915/1917 synthase